LIQICLATIHIDSQQTHKTFCFDSPNDKSLPNNKTKKCKQTTILEKNATYLEANNSLQIAIQKSKVSSIVEHHACSKHQVHNKRLSINNL
jgi:hypothetical protein